jgi:hypothetical protein
MGGFAQWSYNHLGQWHYALGYLITLLAHNGPLLLSVAACLWYGARLYRAPSRARVCSFFGALLLGVGYEYHKHVAPTLRGSLDMVLWREIAWLNTPVQLLVGPVMQGVLFAAMVFFLGYGFWLEAGDIRRGEHGAPTPKRSVE